MMLEKAGVYWTEGTDWAGVTEINVRLLLFCRTFKLSNFFV